MNHYNNHIFVCTNQRQDNSQSCGSSGAHSLLDYIKSECTRLKLKENKKLRISSAGCLGNCKQGPVLVVYPAGKWYSYNSKEDIDNLLLALMNS
ncbi:MAG: (2Fe-2S) ferredoxin domain-containing protein [Rickettsiaceae bacterium]|nr:MAG: (2Fe-2S) ferredoxin domain-containing protein [Rickettsiaceae bacterium]